jgi:membrane protease YdiL (CAAX protease family)
MPETRSDKFAAASAPWLRRWWRGFVVAPLRRAEEEARARRAADAGGLDRKTVTVLLGAAVLLTMQRYLCMADEVGRILDRLDGLGLSWLTEPLAAARDERSLAAQLWWAVGTFVCFLVLPALVVRLAFGERLADYGLKLRGACADAWVYAAMVVVMAPLVLTASASPEFQRTYPFYRPPDGRPGPGFWCWEALYALQFVGLEFFFRGFLVHGLKHRFGAYAIPAMTVPYCMLHFTKPMPEAVGSIVAGLALGFLSLKNRSIVLGAAIHVTVALSMDLTALWRKGALGW